MKKSHLIIASSFTAISFMTTAVLIGCKSKSGKTLVKIGSESITESDLDTLARVNPRLKPRLATPAGRDKVLDNYVEQELLYQESIRQGINKSPDVKDKIALYEKIIVAQSLLEQELNKKVHEYYDNNKDEFERIKISHILVKIASPEEAKQDSKDKIADKTKKSKDQKSKDESKKPKGHTEAEAQKLVKDIQDKLAKGEDFGVLAKQYSEDEKTKENQGDLNYVTIRDKRLERWGWLALAEKAFTLDFGKISDPIKTKDGIHLIKVTEAKSTIPFEEAETGLQFRLQADLKNNLLADLKKKFKVEYVNKDQAPAQPAPATPNLPASPADQPSAAPAPLSSPSSAPAHSDHDGHAH